MNNASYKTALLSNQILLFLNIKEFNRPDNESYNVVELRTYFKKVN